jgi:hypothetical protein
MAELLKQLCRNHCPGVSATLTATAFDRSSSRWLGISDLIAEPEGPSFISRTVTHRPEAIERLVHFTGSRQEKATNKTR